ncbi:hypothetical protein [Citrobacter sp. BDA59-3]|uniref:hypothetical protein n=1 Tax=Citrobacter sp. BDA59-3 TaxID=2781952 RepID=UPI001881D4C5|nr:hypothetical protein [Citrobacter sp. BDA59-3]QOV67340.1 hypothetical protein IP582_16960 [Citrobacter sp. BDA59-3]
MMKIKGCVFLICSFLLYPIATQAFSSCTFRTEPGDITATKSFTMPISETLSTPPDIPTGKGIYRQNISFSSQRIFCVNDISTGQFHWGYDARMTSPLSSGYSNAIYQTGESRGGGNSLTLTMLKISLQQMHT